MHIYRIKQKIELSPEINVSENLTNSVNRESMSSKNLDHIYYGLVDEEPPVRVKPVKATYKEKKEKTLQEI